MIKKQTNYVGMVFFYYTVLEEKEPKIYISRNGHSTKKRMVLCRCICGKENIVQINNLNTGATKSCGCKKSELNILNRKRFTRFAPGDAAAKCLYGQYRRGAKLRKIEFKISLEEFKNTCKKNCIYCGKEPAQKARYLFSISVFKLRGIRKFLLVFSTAPKR